MNLRKLIIELRAWANSHDEDMARRDIESLARAHGGEVTWQGALPVPQLRTVPQRAGDRVIYRGESMTREEAERHRQWDNLMALRHEARTLIRALDHEQPLAMFAGLRRLMEE